MWVHIYLVVTPGFRTKNLYEFLFHSCYMPRQPHSPWFCYSKEVPQTSITSSLLGPYILINNLLL
jgi:hypothetical protein